VDEVEAVSCSYCGGTGSGSEGSVSVKACRGDETERTRSRARSHFGREE
jgi:hypothetical protein